MTSYHWRWPAGRVNGRASGLRSCIGSMLTEQLDRLSRVSASFNLRVLLISRLGLTINSIHRKQVICQTAESSVSAEHHREVSGCSAGGLFLFHA